MSNWEYMDCDGYDAATAATLAAYGFADVSWANDAFPSFFNEDAGLLLWIADADPASRDCRVDARFSLVEFNDETGDQGELVASDDFEKIAEFLHECDLVLGTAC